MTAIDIDRVASVLAACKRLEGMPFRHRGRFGESSGVDCAGFVRACFESAGATIIEDARYSVRPSPTFLESTLLDNFFDVVPDGTDGDVVQLMIEGVPRHLGIVEGNGFWHVEHGRHVEWTEFDSRQIKIKRFWRLTKWQR